MYSVITLKIILNGKVDVLVWEDLIRVCNSLSHLVHIVGLHSPIVQLHSRIQLSDTLVKNTIQGIESIETPNSQSLKVTKVGNSWELDAFKVLDKRETG